ncbi:MAG: hypothetical protein ACR2PL_14210 [Dehalococcoidia bacterium]
MTNQIDIEAFLTKSQANLESAVSERANGRYNACANRQRMLKSETTMDLDERSQEALVDLQDMIRARYPSAAFEAVCGEDPVGFYLRTTVDLDDVDDVMDVVLDRLYLLQVEEGLPVYVLPVPPYQRVAEELARRRVTNR